MDQSIYLVVGLGKTGQSVARYLQRRNKPFVIFDTREEVKDLAEIKAMFPGVDVFLKDFPTTLYSQLAGVIASPGIPLNEPFLQQAFQLKIPVYGDIECFAQEVEAPVIAITGTNGKSTVTTLVGEMARAAGLTVAVAGNIGSPVLDKLDENICYDLWVLELSSFQLETTYSLKPVAATILNVCPDHLDRHPSFADYTNAKQRIYSGAKQIVINREDKLTVPTQENANFSALITYGLDKPRNINHWGIKEDCGSFSLAYGDSPILPVEQLRLKGKHNWQNALAASALATLFGIRRDVIISVLQSFTGLPHRCQWVRTLDGVEWINDSKGTNVGATIAAILGIGNSMQGRIVLIAGGRGKEADFTALQSPVVECVRQVIVFGEAADEIAQAINGFAPVVHANHLDEAIILARKGAQTGDIVLFSPACASFDMFRDFNHRGEVFSNMVNNL